MYVFFIGTSKLFGIFIFICPISLFMGYAAVNYFTSRVMEERPRYAELLRGADQVSAIFANAIWDNDKESQASARFLQVLSMTNIAWIIWLEFAVFSALLAKLFNLTHVGAAIGMFIVSLAVLYITLKYGMRGFVFSDILLSPLIGVGSLTILSAFVLYLLSDPRGVEVVVLLEPVAPLRDCLLFVGHVFILNFFFVLLTEPHWFRVWIFGHDRSSRLQRGSIGATSALWVVLAIIGLIAGAAAPPTSTLIGLESVANLLEQSVLRKPVYIVLFWVAAAAAVFSTAEAQIYSLLLTKAYDAKAGQIDLFARRPGRPFLVSGLAASTLAIIYYVVLELQLPFEKLIFILVPICLNGLPALTCVARRLPVKTWYLYLSIILYTCCAVAGLILHKNGLFWTLMAAVAPLLVSLFLLMRSFVSATRGR